ncbi:dorsal-ventral patterning protein Sog isoform X2 [Ixodes scapularis]
MKVPQTDLRSLPPGCSGGGEERGPQGCLRWACDLRSLLCDHEGLQLLEAFLEQEGADTGCLSFWYACNGFRSCDDPEVKLQDSNVDTQQLKDQGSKKTPKEILSSGGCQFQMKVFPNGEEWHPTVQPFGEMKCIRCHCKDGKSRCRRQRCAKLSCPIKIQKEDECCPRCADNGESHAGDRPPRRAGRKRKTRAGMSRN